MKIHGCSSRFLRLLSSRGLILFAIFQVGFLFPLIYFRLLEFYILNGSTEGAIDHVIKSLSDPNRNNPQELDKAMISFLRDVLRYKDEDHIKAARKIRID